VRSDILAGDVGNELSIAVLLAVQDQRSLVALVLRSESFAAEEKAKLQWHIEARQPSDSIQRNRGEIVYAVAALFDDPLDFRETNFAGIVIFQGAAGHEAEVIDGKDNSTEDRLVAGVKRTVDENVCALDPSAHWEESDCTRCSATFPTARPIRFAARLLLGGS